MQELIDRVVSRLALEDDGKSDEELLQLARHHVEEASQELSLDDLELVAGGTAAAPPPGDIAQLAVQAYRNRT
jgi:hypothetical protein